MSSSADVDIGPLSWVKGEIDLSLDRAADALRAHAREPGTGAQLRAAQGALHQAHGALAVVGLAGVSEFSQAIEQLLLAVDQGLIAWSDEIGDAALQAMAALHSYLDDLLAGARNQPLNLYPVYRSLLNAQGVRDVPPSDLFFPDLSQRPPRREVEFDPPTPEAALVRLKAARMGFQRGLLKWLRDDAAGLREMRNAVAIVEMTQSQPSARAPWWVALGALDAIALGGVETDSNLKRLGSRLDAQIRKMLEGSTSVSERLMRDLLYVVATSTQGGEQIDNVRYAYRLDDLVPRTLTSAESELRGQLRSLREQVAQARSHWGEFSAGVAAALPPFHEATARLAALGESLQQVDLTRLVSAIANLANLLRKNPLAHSEVIAVDVASALLLIDRRIEAIEQGEERPAPEFAQQVDLLAGRLSGLMRGESAAMLDDPLLADLVRQARAALGTRQVTEDARTALKRIEQALDCFFRDPQRTDELEKARLPLQQVEAALRDIGQTRAAEVVAECATSVAGFVAPGQTLQTAQFEDLARRLSAVSLFIERMQTGEADIDALLALATPGAASLPAEPVPPAASVESELASHTEMTRTLVGALRHAPQDAGLRTELQQNLRTLRADAELVADKALERKASAAIAALDAAQSVEHIELAVAPITGQLETAPDVEAERLAAAPEAEVDAELIAIFLEEAGEVLAAMAGGLARVELHPADHPTLVDLRRGFHTLKGSGRMVGLTVLADAAWQVEDAMNHWLQRAHSATPALLDLVRTAHALFNDWVARLHAGETTVPDTAPLFAACARLQGEGAETAAPGPAEAVAPVSAFASPSPTPTPSPAPEQVSIGPVVLSPALFDTYLGEARAHVDLLKRESAAAAFKPPHANMRRSAHTLASASATVGFGTLQELAHALETALDRFGDQGYKLDPGQHRIASEAIEALSTMLDAVAAQRMPERADALADALRTMVPTTAADTAGSPDPGVERRRSRLADEIDPQLLPLFLEEAMDLGSGIADALRAWREAPADATRADAVRRLLHTLKGSARMAGAMGIGELAHGMETRIELGTGNADLLDDIEASFDRIGLLLDELRGAPPAGAEEPAATGESETETGVVQRGLLRVSADDVDLLVNEGGEIALSRSRIESEMRSLRGSLRDLSDNVLRLRNQLREVEIQAETQIQSRQLSSSEQHEEFDPLEMDRYTRLQELTRLMAESVNDVATVQHSLLRNLDHADAALAAQSRLNRDLSQRLMGMRMVPVSTVAERLHRVVRQTAKDLDKRANLDLRGGSTGIDRAVLEKMLSPIEHLLRNAIAHGIEPREARQAAGKPDQGEIVLAVSQEGGEVLFELSDDGAGIDYAAIRAEAERRGLGNIAQADLSPAGDDSQLTQLIFMPGFTTANAVSVVAGRGVGMDVVRTETVSLGGRIEVESRVGRGTTFRIHLPVTLAVAPVLMVKSGERAWGIPAAMVEQATEVKPEPMEAARSSGRMQWQGADYPLHYLPHLLGDAGAMPAERHRIWLILLKGGTRRMALEVDELIGNREVVMKGVGPQLARVPGIAGATVLDDGEIALLLNPVALAGHTPVEVKVTPAAAEAAHEPTVMVVDDSITVRKIASRQLERAGYRVLTAKDGADALEQLQHTLPDVMLADIEMPRMDGFTLARNVRNDARLKRLPIIMITSRIADKHRNHAIEIGVDHYLGKPYDEQELLKLVAGYVARA
jgi:chemosensory pili system protein ChpA (sensor histidine kinase/response regulator)